MNYYKYSFQHESDNEILLAFLSQLSFDTFEEEEDGGLNAYVSEDNHTEDFLKELMELQERMQFSMEKEHIPAQNWNAAWEANFQPILVGDFCGIRANFHEPIASVKHEIIIHPKMAFGTGHHETTFMVIERMQTISFTGKKVLDYGCGTGVLAILAALENAAIIDAIDIDPLSYENTIENCQDNSIANVNALRGVLTDIETDNYDVILANINRHVILENFGLLSEKLTPNGTLIISGILHSDETLILDNAAQHSFKLIDKKEKNGWLCLTFERISR